MKQFTAQQKEIVARKLGYDGPMQGFDEFLASDPALSMRYNSLAGKLTERMAKGGLVKKFQTGGLVNNQDLAAEWARAESSGDYSKIGSMISGIDRNTLKSTFGLSDADLNYIYSRPGVASTTTYTPTYTPVPTPAPAPRPAPVPTPAPASAPVVKEDAVTQAWRMAEATGDYSKIGSLISGMTPTELRTKYGITQQDIDYIYSRPGVVSKAPAPAPAPATSTPINYTGIAMPSMPPAAPPIDLQGQLNSSPRITGMPTVTAQQTAVTPLMVPQATQAGGAEQAGVVNAQAAPGVTTGTVAAPTATAAQAAPAVAGAVAGMEAQQGVVSEQAQVTAAQMAPTTTAVSGLEAAQGTAAQVTGAPTRTAQAGEMVSGTAVDQARVEQALAQQQAAQGVVAPEMTVQGQLNQLLQNFDAGNPPPWAAATMRTATAQMAARGLSASSMAGQAIIQATLEAATPIAAADAKVFETMGLQNLSNRQQMAMLVAQQRAQFLGQEFDQTFQTRVLNAAKISDIANKNFDAQTQIALENARLANSMDLANLSAKNALVLAEAAQISQLETQNLSNLQQAAVENAKAFLAMDMQNLNNRQQTELFKVQTITNAMLQDASLQNAVNITNATNQLDADKITAQLKFQADALNLAEQNKISLSNAMAANELAKFNAQQQNAREEFNANMVNQINIANAKVLAEVSMANTAAVNAANALNAKTAVDLTSIEYAQLSQTYRDMLEMSWKSGESAQDRATELAKATISANAGLAVAAANADANAAKAIGGASIEILKNWGSVKSAIGDVWDLVTGGED